MSGQLIIQGRPDFEDHDFGVTRPKRHAQYVYSNQNGALIHKVSHVSLSWYQAQSDHLVRLTTPNMTIRTICGQQFFGSKNRGGKQRLTMCAIPKPDAVLCGKCHGEEATFGKHGNAPCDKRAATARLGCITEVQASASLNVERVIRMT